MTHAPREPREASAFACLALVCMFLTLSGGACAAVLLFKYFHGGTH